MELDAKLAACTEGEEEDKRRLSGAMAERETRVIGVYRQVRKFSARCHGMGMHECADRGETDGAGVGRERRLLHVAVRDLIMCLALLVEEGRRRVDAGFHFCFLFFFVLEERRRGGVGGTSFCCGRIAEGACEQIPLNKTSV